jgi:hypothetical protein
MQQKKETFCFVMHVGHVYVTNCHDLVVVLDLKLDSFDPLTILNYNSQSSSIAISHCLQFTKYAFASFDLLPCTNPMVPAFNDARSSAWFPELSSSLSKSNTWPTVLSSSSATVSYCPAWSSI